MVLYNVQRKNDMLQCEHCEYTSAHSKELKTHSREHSKKTEKVCPKTAKKKFRKLEEDQKSR